MGNASRTDTCLPTSEVKWCLVLLLVQLEKKSAFLHYQLLFFHTLNLLLLFSEYGKTLPQNKHQGACSIIKKTNFFQRKRHSTKVSSLYQVLFWCLSVARPSCSLNGCCISVYTPPTQSARTLGIASILRYAAPYRLP